MPAAPIWEQRWHPLREEWVVGPEIGRGNFLSDTSPDASAVELKALPAVHRAAR